jgi:hypothetical protein
MFYDERINTKCGKIYSRGILISVLITLLYVISRTVTLFMQGTLHTVLTYTEAVILLFGIGILFAGTLLFRKDRDERIEFERHMFYKKAAKAFVIAVFGTYILTIPFTTIEMLGHQPHNHLLILLEVVGYLYIFYSFKTKEININYSFIAEEGWNYYRRVFLNIGVLCLGLFPPFILASAWELALNESPAGALTILIAYVSSALGLSMEYFFISLTEKTSYDSIDEKRFTLGARICMLVCLAVRFSLAVLQCVYVHFVTGNLQAIPNAGAVVATVSRQSLRIELLLAVLVGLAVCHMMSQSKRGSLLRKVCRTEILLLALSATEATLTPVWYRAFSEETIYFIANRITPYLSFASFMISLAMWILFIKALTKELGVSRILWLIPVCKTVIAGVNIFLNSQSMLRAGTYCTHAADMLSLVLLTVLLWKYRGFASENT